MGSIASVSAEPLNKRVAPARRELAERLRLRRREIEQALATRVYAISRPPELADPDYVHGLRSSLEAALEFALCAVEQGEDCAPDVPLSLLVQARMAARSRVPLETVLRRYCAGYALLTEFVFDEIDSVIGHAPPLRDLMRGHAAVFDRLLEQVSEEHRRETERVRRSPGDRRTERVLRLLAGEPVDAAGLDYELRGFHVCVVSSSADPAGVLAALGREADMRSLSIALPGGRRSTWLGSRRALQSADMTRLLDRATALAPADLVLAFGEPGEGLPGWRLTHRQALAALPIARRQGLNVVRYADVALLTSVTSDDLLLESLRQIYIVPLSGERDGGRALRATVRAYLACGRNISSTAAALAIGREAVRNRLRAAEEKLGRPIDECAAELETALRLDRRDVPSVALLGSENEHPD